MLLVWLCIWLGANVTYAYSEYTNELMVNFNYVRARREKDVHNKPQESG